MTQEIEAVTAQADTQDKPDTIEVETNIEVPEGSFASNNKSEPKEEPPKTINPRTQARKAEKERLIRESAEAKAEANRWKQQYEEMTKPKADEKKEKDFSKEPNIVDYTDALEFTRDLAKYDRLQERQADEKNHAEATRQSQVQSFESQANEIRANMPDFDTKVQQFYDAGLITPPIENAVLQSSMSGKLTEHFLKFPGDLQQLGAYRPELLPQAIKSIESFISKGGSEAKEEPLRQTNAKPPIASPGNSAKTDRSINSYTQEEIENMPLKEWEQVTRRR